MYKNIIYLTSLFILYILLLGCAQEVAPTGGKKDEIPPKLLATIPINKSINFNKRELSLTFNELIDVSNIRQELLIFPEIEGGYDYKLKSNNITIKFDKDLQKNTTYTLNFRNGIKDLNEKNNAKNLSLIFSTGNKLDSLIIDGYVFGLFNNKPVNEALVTIYKLTDTLDIKKTRPTYFYKTDTSGYYKLENIKEGLYKMYVFTDNNNNLKYDAKNELIAFYKDTLILKQSINNLNFKVYMADTIKPKIQKTIPRSDEYQIIYNKGIKNIDVIFKNKTDSIPYIYKQNLIKFYNLSTKKDTITVNISVLDSSKNIYSYTQKIKFRDNLNKTKKQKNEAFNFIIKPTNGESIEKNTAFELIFEDPILNIDINKINIYSDTIKQDYKIKKIWNKTKSNLTFTLKTNTKNELKIELNKGAFINIKGDSSKALSNVYKILNSEDYGLLEGKIEGDKNNKIIQLIDTKYNIIQEQISAESFKFINIKPGVYYIRVIYDTNNNNIWDFGDIKNEIKPEEVFINNIPYNIKANFELTGQIIRKTQ